MTPEGASAAIRWSFGHSAPMGARISAVMVAERMGHARLETTRVYARPTRAKRSILPHVSHGSGGYSAGYQPGLDAPLAIRPAFSSAVRRVTMMTAVRSLPVSRAMLAPIVALLLVLGLVGFRATGA